MNKVVIFCLKDNSCTQGRPKGKATKALALGPPTKIYLYLENLLQATSTIENYWVGPGDTVHGCSSSIC